MPFLQLREEDQFGVVPHAIVARTKTPNGWKVFVSLQDEGIEITDEQMLEIESILTEVIEEEVEAEIEPVRPNETFVGRII